MKKEIIDSVILSNLSNVREINVTSLSFWYYLNSWTILILIIIVFIFILVLGRKILSQWVAACTQRKSEVATFTHEKKMFDKKIKQSIIEGYFKLCEQNINKTDPDKAPTNFLSEDSKSLLLLQLMLADKKIRNFIFSSKLSESEFDSVKTKLDKLLSVLRKV